MPPTNLSNPLPSVLPTPSYQNKVNTQDTDFEKISNNASTLLHTIQQTFDRDAILQEATDSSGNLSARNCLFISHIIQGDCLFNQAEICFLNEDKTKIQFKSVRSYKQENFKIILAAFAALHKTYYKVSTNQTGAFKNQNNDSITTIQSFPLSSTDSFAKKEEYSESDKHEAPPLKKKKQRMKQCPYLHLDLALVTNIALSTAVHAIIYY